MGSANTTGCSTSYSSVAIYVNDGVNPILSVYGSRNPDSPYTFTITAASSIQLAFHYAGYNFPQNSYLIWAAPQIEQGSIVTAYKQSTYGLQKPGGVTSTTCTQWTNGLCTHN